MFIVSPASECTIHSVLAWLENQWSLKLAILNSHRTQTCTHEFAYATGFRDCFRNYSEIKLFIVHKTELMRFKCVEDLWSLPTVRNALGPLYKKHQHNEKKIAQKFCWNIAESSYCNQFSVFDSCFSKLCTTFRVQRSTLSKHSQLLYSLVDSEPSIIAVI